MTLLLTCNECFTDGTEVVTGLVDALVDGCDDGEDTTINGLSLDCGNGFCIPEMAVDNS